MGGGLGGGGVPPLSEVFLSISIDDKTSAPEVFSSCSFIRRTHFETSLVMAANIATIVGDVTGLQQRYHP